MSAKKEPLQAPRPAGFAVNRGPIPPSGDYSPVMQPSHPHYAAHPSMPHPHGGNVNQANGVGRPHAPVMPHEVMTMQGIAYSQAPYSGRFQSVLLFSK